MKIFCVGRNYAEHAKELNNEVPTAPVIFMKPPTALLTDNEDFYYPNFTKDLHYECEIVLRICKNGRSVSEKFARSYYNAMSVGIDFTARDLQQQQKEKGLPWEIAKAFDHSAVIGSWKSLTEEEKNKPFLFSLKKNTELVQEGNTEQLLYSFEKIIAYLSQFFTLNMGDLIFTGTPKGVGPVNIGDRLSASLFEEELLNFAIK
ncbi:acylpyruvase FAHD1, mitochondrial [Filimonas sp.]|jgi:2-keto-4-pentenoate hydratase/2-oxohepta-3-ene-1,7-dioic acid hydratase in catechol pathway|nr:acylpyruvase FAHD1, mitochondrial [Filimonas sp.]